jgi:hypothetical protein
LTDRTISDNIGHRKADMTLKPKYTVEDLDNAITLMDEAYEAIRNARRLNGFSSIAWSTRIDVNGIMTDIENITEALTSRISDLREDGEEEGGE